MTNQYNSQQADSNLRNRINAVENQVIEIKAQLKFVAALAIVIPGIVVALTPFILK